jgi:hypothetical protein
MLMGGISYTREHVFQVLEIWSAINSLVVINAAGGNIHPWVV